MDGEDDDMRYDFSALPDKRFFHYVLGFYTAFFFALIFGIAWKLRGYNKRRPKLSEVLDWQEKRSKRRPGVKMPSNTERNGKTSTKASGDLNSQNTGATTQRKSAAEQRKAEAASSDH